MKPIGALKIKREEKESPMKMIRVLKNLIMEKEITDNADLLLKSTCIDIRTPKKDFGVLLKT
jgi:hypothetical protein